MPTIVFTNALTGKIKKTIDMKGKTSGEVMKEVKQHIVKRDEDSEEEE